MIDYTSSCSSIANANSLPANPLSDPDATAYFSGGGRTLAGVHVNSRSALGYPAFFRGVSLVANVVGKLPLLVRKVQKDGGTEVDKSHPAYHLLNRIANRSLRMSASTMQRAMIIHAQTRGNGYALIQRSASGMPESLYLLDPDATSPVMYIKDRDQPWNIDLWYVTTINGSTFRFPCEDVLHFKHPMSPEGYVGLSVVDLMRQSLGLGIAVREFGARFFGEGANAGGVLMVPGKIKMEAQKNLLKHWNEMTAGMRNAHKVAVVTDGTKFQRISFSPDEAQFLETKKFDLIEMSNIIGVPPHKLGDSSRSAYNSIEAENRNALDESYDPWLCMVEEECEAKLLTETEQEDETHIIQFDRSKMIQTTWTERMNGYKAGKEAGILTTNDCLRSEGLATIGPSGDKRYVPANWTVDSETESEDNGDDQASEHQDDPEQGVQQRRAVHSR